MVSFPAENFVLCIDGSDAIVMICDFENIFFLNDISMKSNYIFSGLLRVRS